MQAYADLIAELTKHVVNQAYSDLIEVIQTFQSDPEFFIKAHTSFLK